MRRADDPERGAVAGRGESAGVAVGEDPRAVGHERGARAPDGAIGLQIGFEKRQGRLRQSGRRRLRILLRFRAERSAHAIERPEQVHRSRSTRRQRLERCLHRGLELAGRAILLPARFQRHTEGSGAADRWSAAHDHSANRLGHFGRARAAHVFEAIGEGALVDQLEPRPSPAQALDGYRFR